MWEPVFGRCILSKNQNSNKNWISMVNVFDFQGFRRSKKQIELFKNWKIETLFPKFNSKLKKFFG